MHVAVLSLAVCSVVATGNMTGDEARFTALEAHVAALGWRQPW